MPFGLEIDTNHNSSQKQAEAMIAAGVVPGAHVVPNNVAAEIHGKTVVESKKISGDDSGGQLQPNAVFAAWLAIVQAVNVEQHVAQTQANILAVNANLQAKINSEQEQIHYHQIPQGLTGDDLANQIEVIQAQNDEVEVQRQALTNDEMLLRQESQTTTNQAFSSTSNSENSINIGSGLLNMCVKMINGLFR